MTKDTLKRLIRRNYGTLSNFARKNALNRYELQKTFARKVIPTKEAANLVIMASRTNDQSGGDKIPADKLEALRNEIYAMGGVESFCTIADTEGIDFSRASVFQVLQGKRMKTAKCVKNLFKYFEIEI